MESPYTLVVTGVMGSAVVHLGTEEAKGWQTTHSKILEYPMLAELRPVDVKSLWPLIRVTYPRGTSFSFAIKTTGKLSTGSMDRDEHKTYRLGWVDHTGKSVHLCAHDDGTISLEGEE